MRGAGRGDFLVAGEGQMEGVGAGSGRPLGPDARWSQEASRGTSLRFSMPALEVDVKHLQAAVGDGEGRDARTR
nr:hypothetical protein CFP56_11919 [Quercus suber]